MVHANLPNATGLVAAVPEWWGLGPAMACVSLPHILYAVVWIRPDLWLRVFGKKNSVRALSLVANVLKGEREPGVLFPPLPPGSGGRRGGSVPRPPPPRTPAAPPEPPPAAIQFTAAMMFYLVHDLDTPKLAFFWESG